MTFCPECGKKIPDDSIYCPYCRVVVDKARAKESKRKRSKKSKYEKIYDESSYSLKTEKKTKATQNVILVLSIILIVVEAFVHFKMPLYNVLMSAILLIITPIAFFKCPKGALLPKILSGMTIGLAFFLLNYNVGQAFKYGFLFNGNPEKERNIVVSDCGVCIDPNSPKDDPIALYYIAISNPNDTLVAFRQHGKIRMVDYKDNFLTYEYLKVPYILPSDTVYIYGSSEIYGKDSVHSIEAEVSLNPTTYINEDYVLKPIEMSDLEITKVTVESEDNCEVVTGRLTNYSDYELTNPQVIAVFMHNDDVVSINYTTLRNVLPGGTVKFEIQVFGDLPRYDSVECYPVIY